MTSLHELQVSELDDAGDVRLLPALHPSRAKKVKFVLYAVPPTVDCEPAAVEEWLYRAKCIERDLHWLLKLKHDRFWCQMIFCHDIHHLLDSYLPVARRAYDVASRYPVEVEQQEEILRKLFFLVCLRSSTHKETPTNIIDTAVFGEILYENFIFDIARIMDICALYGNGNSDTVQLVTKMIDNIFKQQPNYIDDLKQIVPTILQVLDNICARCGIQHQFDSSSGDRLPLPLTANKLSLLDVPISEFSSIIDDLSDVFHTLNAFLKIYSAGASVFWEADGFPVKLAARYELLTEVFNTAFSKRCWEDGDEKQSLKRRFRRCQISALRLFRVIVYTSCLKPLVAGNTDSVVAEELVEGFLETMNTVLSDKRFLAHQQVLFPFSNDCSIVTSSPYHVDETRLRYIREACDDAVALYVKCHANKDVCDRLTVDQKGQQKQDQSERAVPSSAQYEGHDTDEQNDLGACASVPKISSVELESMVSAVKDLLPDLGEGFVRLCLVEYNYDVERVINAVLEDQLLPSLQDVDRQMAYNGDSSNFFPSDDAAADSAPAESLLQQRRNIYAGDEFDVFSRDDVALDRIHKGKRSNDAAKVSNGVSDDVKERIVRSFSHAPVDLKNLDSEDYENVFEYDDEYDDTYDSHTIDAVDADSADELLMGRRMVTPRIFQSSRSANKGGNDDDESDGTEDVEAPTTSSSLSSRDAFLEDPAKLRQQREERYAAQRQQQAQRSRNRPTAHDGGSESSKTSRDVKGGPRGQGQSADVLKNRAWKEANKATRVHHNRKILSDRKRQF